MSTSTRATGAVSAGSQAAAVRRRVAAALALASSTAARSPGSISASGASWDVMRPILSARPDSRTRWASLTLGGGCNGLQVSVPPLERGSRQRVGIPTASGTRQRAEPERCRSDADGGLQLVGAVGVLPGELRELATEVAVG